MRFYRQIMLLAIFMHLSISCWARTRILPNPSHLNEMEDLENDDQNNNHEYELMERAMPFVMKAKNSVHHYTSEERRKKYLGEASNLPGGRSLQGLWAMPGRR